MILLEQVVPLRAPDALDHVPAGAAEDRFELLDDLAVAAHRAVEALQVAVDHEDQVVELLARRQRDGAERFGLVGLAVAEERPDLGVGLRLEAAIFEVAIEARLVDRHDRAEAHRDGRELPEVRHQPRMRIRRQAAARLQLAAEVLELLLVEAAFEERARVDAGRGVALEIDDVAFVAVVAAAEEVVEADFVQRRGRGERRDVAADAVFDAVGAHDHRHRVPAHEALDAALDLAAAGIRHLLVGVDGVDVGRVRRERQLARRSSGRGCRVHEAGGRRGPALHAAARRPANRATRGFRGLRAGRHRLEQYFSWPYMDLPSCRLSMGNR